MQLSVRIARAGPVACGAVRTDQLKNPLPPASTWNRGDNPELADQIANRVRRGSKRGRSPEFDAEVYRQRNTVERAFNPLKALRAVAMRTDKREYAYQGTATSHRSRSGYGASPS